ncbi:MAG: DUF2339 domain-containing protein [Candidatus Paceibacterota bacterium]
MAILALIVTIAAFFYLNNEIDALRREIERLKGVQGKVAQLQPQTHNPATVQPVQSAATPPHIQPRQPSPVAAQDSAFVLWLKQNFLMKLGALLLLVAFGWFVSYAFANNWIGPMGRITLGLVSGVSIMALGMWRIRTYLHQGAVFVVLGSTSVLLTVYAAREIYDFFTPLTALLMMFVTVSFVAFVSVRYKNEPLALAGLLLAGAAPLLTASPEPSLVSLMSYLMVIVLGSLWVVYLTGANSLTTTALLVVGFYSAPYLLGFQSAEDRVVGLLFSFAFTALFFVANVISIMYRQEKAARQGHVMSAFLTGVFLMSWIAFAAAAEWQSLLYAAWMVVFALGAYAVYAYTNDRVPFYIYSAVSIAFLAAATAVELDGPFLTIALTIEVAALVGIATTLLRSRQIAHYAAWLFAGPVALSVESITASSWAQGVFHWDAVVLLVLTFALALASLALLQPESETKNVSTSGVGYGEIAGIGAIVYLLLLVWLVSHALLSEDMGTMVSLVVYTVFGLSMYVRGVIDDQQTMKIGGGLLLGLVITRLFMVDVWTMELVGRIITFFAVGVLLMSTAFISRLHKPEQQ